MTGHFSVFCYSSVASPDHNTRYLMPKIDHYKAVASLSGEQLKEMILADKIDILVDLAGHTSGGNLRVFNMKPAPVQVSYLGYANTSGIKAMDYRITDAWADPPGENEKLYTEQLVRLPGGFLCYTPPRGTPDVAAAPAIANGYVTFGSFNHPAKITPAVITAWSEILKQVSDSRLLLKYRSFTDAHTRKLYLDMFEQQGIDPGRIELLGLTQSKEEHLACYHRVDIGLDTFPYNGTTTTCDTLWMGVPVVVLTGKAHAGRVGVSLLKQLSMDSLIADSLTDYISIATELANDIDRISALRSEIRSRMQNSTLCNGELHTRELETAYRKMWSNWCSDQPTSD